MNNRLFTAAIFSILLFGIQACSTTQSALNPNTPQVYLNSYEEVMEATQKALERADMNIIQSNKIDEDSHNYQYYNKRYDVAGNNNPDGGLGADLTITRLSENRTKVVIKEEEQPALIPGSHKETLGKDVLRELRKLLTHETEQKPG